MLDGRYVHLHEALGLGPMWLQQNAKITGRLPEKTAAPPRPRLNVPAAATPTPPPAAPVSNPPPVGSNIHPARLAALQRIGSSRLQTPAAAEPPTQPAVLTAEHYLAELRGQIQPAALMVLVMCASPADTVSGSLLSGEDGVLFDKMLAAIGLARPQIHLSCWLKRAPDFNPEPPADEVAAACPRLHAELQLARPKALLLMGRFFERADVAQHLHKLGSGIPSFHIPHPQQMLDDPQLKRPAWQTLQNLQAAVGKIK